MKKNKKDKKNKKENGKKGGGLGGFSRNLVSKLKKSKNSLDEGLKIPSPYGSSSKDICGMIRKLFEVEESESIKEEFEFVTSLEMIEKEIFERAIENELSYFPMRLYVKANTSEKFVKKIFGKVARFTQEVGTAHLAVQIADCVAHWFDTSFVFIKEWKGGGATALFYPQNSEGEEVPLIENTKENRVKICKVIQEWNCMKTYNSMSNNCQKFASAIFSSVGLSGEFGKYSGWVGDFIRFVSKNNKEVGPCLVQEGKILHRWKNHEELDKWHNENMSAFPEAESLLKSMHRAFQLQGQVGCDCPHDSPTLLVTNTGKKIPVHSESSYSNAIDSFIPISGAFSSGPKNNQK